MYVINRVIEAINMPLSPKYLRVTAILIAIYKVLTAHVFLFVMLLGLAHAEEMSTILQMSIAEQKCEFFSMTDEQGEMVNEWRFRSAEKLASATLCILYIGTTVATIYVLSCLGLLIGTLRNRHEFFIPWMVVDFFGTLAIGSVVLACGCNDSTFKYVAKWEYWGFCMIMIIFNVTVWGVIRLFYKNLVHMTKLREVAIVAIPCPAAPASTGTDTANCPSSKGKNGLPVAPPYHYRKENMHLSDGGLKHILFDANEANYLV
ncbi:uncharacterized protein LOC125766433 [Anopheles funestus]|uniref:uncharacterized protein LOC125766433 n=1 Tax=Anopheles funestus TaxID=62324 RepID=UPI0020C5BDC0|nr:uncharacterized protein LOC125766433 [Anopheles funestus]XP_049288362.1 uncharacterized protein LOC125766433 [Anopheles funestus]